MTKLINASVEFLNRDTSAKQLKEAKDKEEIVTKYTNSKGRHAIAVLEPHHYASRMQHHSKDIAEYKKSEPWERQYFPSTHEESKDHLKKATAAYHAHKNAIAVHKSLNATPKQKENATRHAEHASVRYWKSEPKTKHDLRSERREDDYHDYTDQYHDNHDDSHLVK